MNVKPGATGIAAAVRERDPRAFQRCLAETRPHWKRSGGRQQDKAQTRKWIKAWEQRWGDAPKMTAPIGASAALQKPDVNDALILVLPEQLFQTVEAEGGRAATTGAASAEGGAKASPRRLTRKGRAAVVREFIKNALPADRFDPGVRGARNPALFEGAPQLDGDGQPRVVAQEFAGIGAAAIYFTKESDVAKLKEAGAMVGSSYLIQLPDAPERDPETVEPTAQLSTNSAEIDRLLTHATDKIVEEKGLCRRDPIVAVLDTGLCPKSKKHRFFEHSKPEFFNATGVKRKNGKPFDVDPMCHGTSVASIVAQVAQGVKIVSVAVFDEPDASGKVYTSVNSLIRGLNYLADRSEDKSRWIINLSLGGFVSPDKTVGADSLLRRIIAEGGVVIAAAGNDGDKSRVHWPSSREDVICVGSLDEAGNESDFSNREAAKGKPEAMAVGENVLATGCNNQDVRQTGTSFAAPIISGLAARGDFPPEAAV